VTFNYVNLGIAAATPRGLTVPNIKDADVLSLLGSSDALDGTDGTPRSAGKTSPADLSGGTISITNIGVFGIDAGTPILNPGEAAILAVGAVRNTPWEYQGEVALSQVMTLSLSFDHRLVDGEQGSASWRTSAPSSLIPEWSWLWSRVGSRSAPAALDRISVAARHRLCGPGPS
jgi:2-oxoisovalerate dehydrogenase E2 component (dihydrolipoyl transacylase)